MYAAPYQRRDYHEKVLQMNMFLISKLRSENIYQHLQCKSKSRQQEVKVTLQNLFDYIHKVREHICSTV